MIDIMQLFGYIDLWIQIYLNMHASPDFLINIMHGILGIKTAEDGSIVLATFYA